MRPRAITSLLVVVAVMPLLSCGGDDRTIAERWNVICREDARERTGANLITAADFRRFVHDGRQTLELLRGVAMESALDTSQEDALAAFAAQQGLERRFVSEASHRLLADVALEFRKPAQALAARVRRAFTAAGAAECAEFPSLR